MLGFFGRWMSDAFHLSLALVFAIAAIQLPALTSDYTAALLQVSNDLRRDIDQREQAARSPPHGEAETLSIRRRTTPKGTYGLYTARETGACGRW